MIRLLAHRALREEVDRPRRRAQFLAIEFGLSRRDRALLSRIVATEVRRRATLRTLVRAFCDRKPTAELATHLHVGLVQLLFLDRVPDHAAVGETVRAAVETLGISKGRLVNAVLRRVAAERRAGHCADRRRDLVLAPWHFERPVFADPHEHPLLWAEEALSLPATLFKRWRGWFGDEEAQRLARAALLEPPLSVRARDEAVAGELLAELAPAGAHPGDEAHIVLLPAAATRAFLACAPFRAGQAHVQGGTAAAAARLVGAARGEHVLDLCAAPGGKTLVLAEAGARVVACDANPARLARLRENLTRASLESEVRVVACSAAAALHSECFDAVLVDAPCSNSGVLAQRPEARWRFGPASRAGLRAIQTTLIAAGAQRVRPGGRLVYSTCSLERDENEGLVRAFLAEHPEFRLDAELSAHPRPESPQGPIDGGYAARLVRGR